MALTIRRRSVGDDDRARDPGPAPAVAGVGDLVVRVGVDDERAAVGIEQGRPALGQGHAVGSAIEMADTISVDDQVRQVARVRPARVLQSVLVTQRVVVATGGRECRRTRSDRVDMDAMETRRQALDVDVDVDVPAAILGQAEPADRCARGVDEGPAALRGRTETPS